MLDQLWKIVGALWKVRAGKMGVYCGLLSMLLLGLGCRPDGVVGSEKFPDYVSKIMRRNCANSGCHTAKSAEAAGGLSLETWDDLFKGSRGGSPVVPYAPEQSFLLYAINTDTSLGPTLLPTMPIEKPALTPQQYEDLRQWIADGARNDRGRERFAPDPTRRKWYVGNQGCDLVTVFDAESRQIMRYISVGDRPTAADEPYSIAVSPDGQFWMVVFATFRPYVELYSTLTDELVARIQLGHNGWNTVAFSPDGRFAFVVGENIGEVASIDLTQRQLVGSPSTTGQTLHGPAVNPTRQTVLVPDDGRSLLYAFDYDGSGRLGQARTIDLVQGQAPQIPGELWPYQVLFLPDGSKYFVICWHSREVRVMDAATDSLLAVIPVGAGPSEIEFSPAKNLLFVSCEDDLTPSGGDPSRQGSIVVIDAQSLQVVRTIYPGFQPRGIAVDEAAGYLIVANRNQLQAGPSQHHTSNCQGRNGYITLLDINTLTMVEGFKPECTVDPFCLDVKD